jgi:hypothetical protein
MKRNPWDVVFWAACAVMLIGLSALALLLMSLAFPDIQGAPAHHRRLPASGPTTVPKPPVHLDKASLIIMQDVDCWRNGVPGATCGMIERTYGR